MAVHVETLIPFRPGRALSVPSNDPAALAARRGVVLPFAEQHIAGAGAEWRLLT
ncbi:hypothetical protein [Bosea sp. OK403]|jgi:hypothetical protein|uniref:hypothetical protein n=1 Tax=Bosea sp. OK403 TaxID=1855286 RepID=UPI001587016B|nr:hypothetical protein [Bosea sp. OK403]